jgi:predicted acetyltransferase
LAALIAPGPRVRRSFLDAHREISADPDHGPLDADRWLGMSIGLGRPMDISSLRDPLGFADFCQQLRRMADEDAPRPEGYVPDTVLWWVDGEQWLGRLSIRHRLTDHLLEVGGHIGYLVRPSARRRGHATAMLRAALPVARALGIDPVLVTCDVDNVASRRVIEANGGRLEDQRGVKLRYWVPTGAPAPEPAAPRPAGRDH